MKKGLLENLVILGFNLIFLLILSLVYTLLVYKGVLNSNMNSVSNISYLLSIIVFFILGLSIGNTKQKNGLVRSIVSAAVVLLVIFLFELLGTDSAFTLKSFVKMVASILAAGVGGALGVNANPLLNVFIKEKN